MYSVKVSSMPYNGLDFAINHANGRLSDDSLDCIFQSVEDLALYKGFLRGPSWDRFHLDSFVFQLLKFLDLDSAWHFYSIFNQSSRAPSDPYHGTDLAKTLLSGVHEYSVSGNHLDLRVAVLTLLFQSFNHSLGRLQPAQDAAKAQTAFKIYCYYRYVDPIIAKAVTKLLFLETAETDMSREARLVRDLNRAVVALKQPSGLTGNLYNRLYLEQRNSRPQLDRKTFLTQELKALAQVQFETSWARAVILPIWMDSVVAWATEFSTISDLRFGAEGLKAYFLSQQPAPSTQSLTRPGNLTTPGTLS